MHEMGIAASVLEAAEKEARLHPRHRVAKIGLRIGEFSGVDTESLRFCFEAIVKSYHLPPVELELEWCRIDDGKRGDELDLAYVELTDSEARTGPAGEEPTRVNPQEAVA